MAAQTTSDLMGGGGGILHTELTSAPLWTILLITYMYHIVIFSLPFEAAPACKSTVLLFGENAN